MPNLDRVYRSDTIKFSIFGIHEDRKVIVCLRKTSEKECILTQNYGRQSFLHKYFPTLYHAKYQFGKKDIHSQFKVPSTVMENLGNEQDTRFTIEVKELRFRFFGFFINRVGPTVESTFEIKNKNMEGFSFMHTIHNQLYDVSKSVTFQIRWSWKDVKPELGLAKFCVSRFPVNIESPVCLFTSNIDFSTSSNNSIIDVNMERGSINPSHLTGYRKFVLMVYDENNFFLYPQISPEFRMKNEKIPKNYITLLEPASNSKSYPQSDYLRVVFSINGDIPYGLKLKFCMEYNGGFFHSSKICDIWEHYYQADKERTYQQIYLDISNISNLKKARIRIYSGEEEIGNFGSFEFSKEKYQKKVNSENSCLCCSYDYGSTNDDGEVVKKVELDCGCSSCSNCIQNWINNGDYPIHCPLYGYTKNDECKKPITCNRHILKDMNEKDFVTYSDLQLQTEMNAKDEDLIKCSNPKCHAVFTDKNNKRPGFFASFMQYFQDEDDANKIHCLRCDALTCKSCKDQYHESISCEEFKKLSPEDKDKKMFDAVNVKMGNRKCPGCEAWIERNEGCNHMTCKCGAQICYRCGVPYLDTAAGKARGKSNCKCGIFQDVDRSADH